MKSRSRIGSSEKTEIVSLFDCDFYTEGPAVDKEGNFFFTTLTGGKIIKINSRGDASLWGETACPNGQRILANGDHLVCESALGAVIRFDRDGKKVETAASGKIEDLMIRTPNDLIVDEYHGFYFTDSVRYDGAVFYVGFDGSKTVVARGLDYPNGICLSKDKTKLFVAESYRNRILVIELKDRGIASRPPDVFATMPSNKRDPLTGNLPDGILSDSDGRIWVAHYGMKAVQLLSPTGELIATYDSGITLTSNLCFINDNHDLLITGGTAEPGPGHVHILKHRDHHS